MTFEATETRAPEPAAEETSAPARRVRRATPERPLAGKMLDFVTDASEIGGRLEGLALMFRSTFLPSDGCPPANWEMAAEIVADVMENMAERLANVSMHAHEVYNHETRGAAR